MIHFHGRNYSSQSTDSQATLRNNLFTLLSEIAEAQQANQRVPLSTGFD